MSNLGTGVDPPCGIGYESRYPKIRSYDGIYSIFCKYLYVGLDYR